MVSTPLTPLDGIRVVDLTTVVFGPYATQILADYGAEVLKVEAPAGDPMRQVGPSVEPDGGALFLGLNRNKRSVVLDLKLASARDALQAVLADADVLIHSMRPAKAAVLGLDPDTICARYPRLIHATLSGFGEGGDYAGRPAYDDIIQGLSGAADLMYRQTGEMRYLPTIAADKTAGLTAAHAVLAALFHRERTGAGQRIEVPMFEAMASFVLAEHYQHGHLDGADRGYVRALSAWRRPYPTSDGHVCLMPYSDRHWRRFFAAIGRDDLAADPRFVDLANRTANIDALYSIVSDAVADLPTEHWLRVAAESDIPAARINRLGDLDDDPHLRSVGFFVEAEHAGHRYRFPRSPVRSRHPGVPMVAPPGLGEHTVEVLREAGLTAEHIDRLLDDGAAVQAATP